MKKYRINYRKIYRDNYGSIPIDNEGRSYEIHHIDGNKHNNKPENLVALSIEEHYKEHLDKGEYGAALLIARRFNLTSSELSALASKHNNERVKNGTNPFLGPENNRKNNKIRVEAGTFHMLGGEIQRRVNRKRVDEGTHHLLGGEIQRRTQHIRMAAANISCKKRVENGTHNFLGPENNNRNNKIRVEAGTHNFLKNDNHPVHKQLASGTHTSQITKECPYCKKLGRAPGIYKHHFNNCKFKI